MAGQERIFVGLGANLGEPAVTLRAALSHLGHLPQTTCVGTSAFYRSAPIDASGPDYVNAVAELRSELEPEALLAQLLAVEQAFGRERPFRHAPRTLDIDLLFHGMRRLDSATLTLPHPRLAQRAFVLAPLADLAPDWTLDGGLSVAQALSTLHDQHIVRIAL